MPGTRRRHGTGAAGYGFLPTGRMPSRDPGRVAQWRARDAGGAPVRPEDFPGARARRGCGTELITRALPCRLRAKTALEFAHDGVRCRITLPAGAFTRRVDGGEGA